MLTITEKNNYVVYVLYGNRLEFLQVGLEKEEAEELFVQKANEWLHPDSPFETPEDVYEYQDSDEYLERDEDVNVGIDTLSV